MVYPTSVSYELGKISSDSCENHRKALQRKLADSIKKMVPLDDIRILLAEGAKVNEPVVQGLRPLHYAVWQRYLEATQLLLTRGGDVNAVDECGYSALHLCAEYGYTDLVRLLLKCGAKVDYQPQNNFTEKFPKTTQGDEPLRLAIRNRHMEVARLLLEHGADPNRRYFFGAEINLVTDLEFLELLLTFGADPDSRDRCGLTPLMKAVRQGEKGLQTALLLLKYGADVNAMTDERNDFRTVLHYAVTSGNYDVINLCVKQGAHLNYDDYDVEKPSPLDLAILKGDPNIVRLLVQSGADVNFSSPLIGSPLHVACADNILNRYEILKMLLKAGANPNLKVYSDVTIRNSQLRPVLVEYLSKNTDPDFEIVHLLLKYGAKVIMKTQFRDPDGILNSLKNVTSSKKIFRLLLEASESFDSCMIRRNRDLNPEQKKQLLDLARNPQTLLRQVRIFLRRFFGSELHKEAETWEIPKDLINYLLFN